MKRFGFLIAFILFLAAGCSDQGETVSVISVFEYNKCIFEKRIDRYHGLMKSDNRYFLDIRCRYNGDETLNFQEAEFKHTIAEISANKNSFQFRVREGELNIKICTINEFQIISKNFYEFLDRVNSSINDSMIINLLYDRELCKIRINE